MSNMPGGPRFDVRVDSAVLEEDGTPVLVLVAVGHRHPAQPWAPSVYQVAHRRPHG